MQRAEGADSFLPLLIYVTVKANPDNLLSNIEWVDPFQFGSVALTTWNRRYINRFRRPERLQGESGYYLSSLVNIHATWSASKLTPELIEWGCILY